MRLIGKPLDKKEKRSKNGIKNGKTTQDLKDIPQNRHTHKHYV